MRKLFSNWYIFDRKTTTNITTTTTTTHRFHSWTTSFLSRRVLLYLGWIYRPSFYPFSIFPSTMSWISLATLGRDNNNVSSNDNIFKFHKTAPATPSPVPTSAPASQTRLRADSPPPVSSPVRPQGCSAVVGERLVDFREDVRHTATLTIAPWQIPHDMKKSKGGEDTYFISAEGNVMGVFDGVGGWSDIGVDPREYSLSLCENCRKAVDELYVTDPLLVLKYGYEKSANITGSSTACIAFVTNKEFHAINVGDSGFKIIRNNEIIFYSREQQHSFNMPYQLGHPDCDIPENGDIYKFTLMDGDVIVMGTDGLFDNLYTDHLVSLVKRGEKKRVQELAESIAKEAYNISKSHSARSPFADSVSHAGYEYQGGKEDDITIIVAKYKEIYAKM